MTVDTSYDPRTGTAIGTVESTTSEQLAEMLKQAVAAAPVIAATSPAQRAVWLEHLAAEINANAEDLAKLADSETALGIERLTGEVARVAGQLRFYGSVAAEGSYLQATIDEASAASPHLARVQVPLGPVAVFGASNFPFAFSLLGNDTASALAAGCPVVVKGHPAHPLLSQRLGQIADVALQRAGAPAGTFAFATGFEAGVRLVQSPHITAVAFTGSQATGMKLWQLASERDVVIPVFAEMGTVNPAVVTPAGGERMAELAKGFVASFTLGWGQFCTKPGLLFAPRGGGAPALVAKALEDSGPRPVMLTESIARSVGAGLDELLAAGASVVARVPGPETGWGAAAAALSVPIESLHAGSRLLDECFGPVALIVEYDDLAQLITAIAALQGALAASVLTGGETDPDAHHVLVQLSGKVGRVAVNDWPTGVAYTWAQQHGGPWPATSQPATTSVGAAALDRFLRPVAFQNVPGSLLPAPLRRSNPWNLPRRINGRLYPAPTS